MGSRGKIWRNRHQLTVPLVGRLTDTACQGEASCALASLVANKCNYGRQALQSTYNGLNVAAHVLSVLISVLCGCVAVGGKATCMLATVPETCIFPYAVYSKVFSGSVPLWEAIKASTKSCQVR